MFWKEECLYTLRNSVSNYAIETQIQTDLISSRNLTVIF